MRPKENKQALSYLVEGRQTGLAVKEGDFAVSSKTRYLHSEQPAVSLLGNYLEYGVQVYENTIC